MVPACSSAIMALPASCTSSRRSTESLSSPSAGTVPRVSPSPPITRVGRRPIRSETSPATGTITIRPRLVATSANMDQRRSKPWWVWAKVGK